MYIEPRGVASPVLSFSAKAKASHQRPACYKLVSDCLGLAYILKTWLYISITAVQMLLVHLLEVSIDPSDT